jgi:hypothetical protein
MGHTKNYLKKNSLEMKKKFQLVNKNTQYFLLEHRCTHGGPGDGGGRRVPHLPPNNVCEIFLLV